MKISKLLPQKPLLVYIFLEQTLVMKRLVEKRPTVLKCLMGKDPVMKGLVEKQLSDETSGRETTYSAEVSGGERSSDERSGGETI